MCKYGSINVKFHTHYLKGWANIRIILHWIKCFHKLKKKTLHKEHGKTRGNFVLYMIYSDSQAAWRVQRQVALSILVVSILVYDFVAQCDTHRLF